MGNKSWENVPTFPCEAGLIPAEEPAFFMSNIEDYHEVVAKNLSLLAPVEEIWQPTDFLPDLTAEDWHDQLVAFRDAAKNLPDDLLIVLVGNMITEEALPNSAISLEQVMPDPNGTGDTPWAHWLRGWTAEENRHGDLLNAYLRLTGRVDMRAIEVTIHHLIRNGFTSSNNGDICAGLIYTAFQERATRLSHGNLAALAAGHGENALSKICRKIAADETRHEIFYTKMVNEMFDRDPDTAVLTYRQVLRGLISMPGRLMADGQDPNLFDHYSAVTLRTGVYTTRDYASIIRHLNKAWNLEGRSVSGKAAKAQEYLCRQPERYENLAGETAERVGKQPPIQFSWLPRQMV